MFMTIIYVYESWFLRPWWWLDWDDESQKLLGFIVKSMALFHPGPSGPQEQRNFQVAASGSQRARLMWTRKFPVRTLDEWEKYAKICKN